MPRSNTCEKETTHFKSILGDTPMNRQEANDSDESLQQREINGG